MHVDRVVLFDNVAFAVPSATNLGAGDLSRCDLSRRPINNSAGDWPVFPCSRGD